ncbi:glycosyltransferase [Mycetocola zhadangensis]|uniref:Glycosyltransferase n=1 Tax=Mycetocola zhadangensis TaxID=1164595 RepID=A0A3L7IYU9_9MICO|nr:glycosyltransferase [Mycetocola zhadangensis]RLQ82671.1 glycosyltransferase [Mycetocola zhadangensis]
MKQSVAIIGTRGYPSYYGGFETAVRKLAPYLSSRGWDVTVYGRKGASKFDDPSRDARVKSVITRGLETKSLSTLTHGLTAVLDAARKKPDVALIMNVANGYWLPLLRLRGIPTLINVDGIEWDRAKWNRLAKFVFRTGAWLTARFGDRLVYDAKAIAERWESDFGVGGVFIPYGGSDVPQLPVEIGLSHRGYILMVARFVPENSVPEFIEAADNLADRWPVVVVGSSGYGGELEEQVRDLAERKPKVRWLGHIADDARLHSLWQHAGVYFHGHSVGGTNPALVQAMACGTPIVARDTVYNREVIGDTGSLVSLNVSKMIEAISRVMIDSSLQNRLANAAKARAAEFYTWDLVNGRYEEALEKLASSAGAKSRSRRREAQSIGQ